MALLVVLALLVWPGDGDVGSRDSRSSVPPEPEGGTSPVLRGVQVPAPESVASQPKQDGPPLERASSALSGVVRDEDAGPIRGATVFLIEKGVEGLHRRMDETHLPPRTETDADGRFHLGAHSPGGQWVGVVANGYVPHHEDGDGVAPGSSVEVTLRRAPELRVTVRSGEAPPPEGTRVLAFGRGRSYVFPGPNAGWHSGSGAEVPADGSDVLLYPPAEGEVIVRARRHRYVSDPPEVRLERLPGRATFDLQPSCGFRFRVVDATTGEPPAGGFDYLVSFLEAGVYDVFARNRVSGRTACQRRVRVPPLRTTTVTLDLEPGLYVDLAAVLPAEKTYARLRLRSPVFGAFPLYGTTDVSGVTYGEGDVPPRDRRYGPYPGVELVLEAETEGGQVDRFTIRR